MNFVTRNQRVGVDGEKYGVIQNVLENRSGSMFQGNRIQVGGAAVAPGAEYFTNIFEALFTSVAGDTILVNTDVDLDQHYAELKESGSELASKLPQVGDMEIGGEDQLQTLCIDHALRLTSTSGGRIMSTDTAVWVATCYVEVDNLTLITKYPADHSQYSATIVVPEHEHVTIRDCKVINASNAHALLMHSKNASLTNCDIVSAGMSGMHITSFPEVTATTIFIDPQHPLCIDGFTLDGDVEDDVAAAALLKSKLTIRPCCALPDQLKWQLVNATSYGSPLVQAILHGVM